MKRAATDFFKAQNENHALFLKLLNFYFDLRLYNFSLYLPPPVLRCFWKDPLMTPHQPTSSMFHCYPLPIYHPFPQP